MDAITVGPPRNKLQALKDATEPVVSLKNDLGLEWAPRYRRSEEYHKANSGDWEYLRALYAKPYHDIAVYDGDQKITLKVKIDVSSIIRNMVADLYFHNPEPMIQARRTPQDRHTNRMLSDLGKAVHQYAGTEPEMRKALITALGVTGGSIIWTSFDQDGEMVEVPALDDNGQQMAHPDTGEPLVHADPETGQAVKVFQPSMQRTKAEYVSLWQMRFDPDGRQWDFSDHRYVIRRYHAYLGDVVKNTETYDDEFRRMVVHWTAANRPMRSATSDPRAGEETDPDYILLTFAEIHDRVTKRIIHLPIGSDGAAEFASARPWPEAFAKANKFPCRIIATDWVPSDADETEGFYPIPLTRRIRGLVEDLTRMYTLFFQSAKSVVRKYGTIKGLLTPGDFSKVMSTDADDVLTFDLDAMRQVFGPNLERFSTMKQMLELFPTGEESAKAIQFAGMIDKVWEQIYQLTGQGPGDRGGISMAGSATEAANMRIQLDKRTADAVAEIGTAYDDITELLFLLLMEYQELPIPYQKTTDAFSQPVWDEFRIDLIEGLDLSFSHVTDSSRPMNKATVRLERSEFLAKAAPFVESPIQRDKLLMWALEPYDYPDVEDLFGERQREMRETGKAGLQLIMQLHDPNGGINPADPNVGIQIMEILSKLCELVTTQQDQEEVAVGAAQGAADKSNPAAGSGPKSATPGQHAAAGAAAGMTNVM